MTHKCPACHRAIRKKAAETPEQSLKRIDAKTKAGLTAAWRRPMPKATRYRE